MPKKVAITLSGGAIKGAFESGAIRYISEQNIDIRVVTGTSVGALNGAMIAQWKYQQLAQIWDTITQDKIYRKWFFRYLEGFFRRGLYDFRPMLELIKANVKVEKLLHSDIRYFPCVVDVNSGETVYAENVPRYENTLHKYIWASATIPVVFPPVKIDGREYVDGGVNEPIPVEKAVQEGKKEGVELYIVILASKRAKPPAKRPGNLLSMTWRTTDLLFDEIYVNDVRIGKLQYWDQKFAIIEPDDVFFNDSFDVNPDKIKQAIESGYNKAKQVLGGIL